MNVHPKYTPVHTSTHPVSTQYAPNAVDSYMSASVLLVCAGPVSTRRSVESSEQNVKSLLPMYFSVALFEKNASFRKN